MSNAMPQASTAIARGKLTRLTSFPPLSRTANRILAAVGDPDLDATQMAEIIDEDPGLTARIIGLANSAYFGQTRAITTVREAIIRVLGLNMVKSLAMSISMAGVFDIKGCSAFDLENYWYKAMGTAVLARLISQRFSSALEVDTESVYLCGLLHNLGELLLAQVFPEALSEALLAFEETPEVGLWAIEKEYIGVNQLEAGAFVLKRWHLPDAITDVISNLELVEYEGPFPVHWETIKTANAWMMSDLLNGPASLPDNAGLLALPGMSAEVLTLIQEQIRDQRESLRAMARLLV